jgi:hypothetical protein
VAGLIFAISRPLASGLLGMGAGGQAETSLILLDRSPSMQQMGEAGQSKLDTGRRQLAQALDTLGSKNWVLIESNSAVPQAFDSLDALVDSPGTRASSSTADLPTMLQSAVDYLTINKSGPSELWICSDLRTADWNVESGNWNVVREALLNFPQSVRIHLLAYPQPADNNLSIRVSDVRLETGGTGNAVSMSLQVSQTGKRGDAGGNRTVPVQIEIDGTRSELSVELSGSQVELRNHRVPLSGNQRRGWGKVALPADQNNSDNEFYFVFDAAPERRIVLISEDRNRTRALELAATIAPDGQAAAAVEVVMPGELDSLVLDGAALVIWQSELPQEHVAGAVAAYVNQGGQVLFFPPTSVLTGIGSEATDFMGVGWGSWIAGEEDPKVMVENWRGDQDLLAATRSGAGLPVGQLQVYGHAKLVGEISPLATLTGGDALLARVPTERGGVYFCSASPATDSSTLASNGIVLYAIIQRAIEQGISALGSTTQRTAGAVEEPSDLWRRISTTSAPEEQSISTEMPWQSGVYADEERLFAINRSAAEDRREVVSDQELARLFDGLDFSRINDSAGNLSSIVREIWRLFLIAMILAMLVEAALCLPRRPQSRQPLVKPMQRAA